MRNFEADKLVRIGDVMDLLADYTKYDGMSHEVDLGDFGSHTLDCDAIFDLDVVGNELLGKAVENA